MLVRVERENAFASAALEAELSRAVQLEPRDRALATELVYGALRVRPFLERTVGAHVKRGLASVDPRVRAHLLVATYQLFFLSRVPAFAAVNACVDAVRVATGPQVAGFANAVLRKLATEAASSPRDAAFVEGAIVASASPWLRAALGRAMPAADVARFLASAVGAPPTGLRAASTEARDGWLAKLREAVPGAEVEASRVSPLGISARGLGRLADLPGLSEGALTIQEEGSQLVGLSLGARPGETVLDACAGRGNKTSLLAREVGPEGAVDAADLHASKLERLGQELAKLGLGVRHTFAVDWSVGAGDNAEFYDRVLVDAPCSGTGTLRRRPEIALRRADRGDADVRALSATQLGIALRAADRVREGGAFVYAVCSVLREEAEEVCERFLAARPDFAPAPFAGEAARVLAGEAPTLRLLPHVHGTDGYFLASFVRRA